MTIKLDSSTEYVFLCLCCLNGLDQNVTATSAFIHELDDARNLGKQGIVFAATDIGAGLDASAALSHDDGAAGDDLSAERFYSQALRIGIAAIPGTA